MRTLERGCAVDDEKREWAVWMNKPKGLEISDRPLYHKYGDFQLRNVVNKKGVPMLVLRGKIPPNTLDLKGMLIQLRADLTKYINQKKKEAGLK